MKKIFLLSLSALLLLGSVGCSDDSTLADTRLEQTVQPAVSLDNIAVSNKYNATLSVKLNEAGTPGVVEVGVLVSTANNPDVTNSTIHTGETPESFSLTETFSPSTTYYVKAYAITTNTIVYSDVKSFTTGDHLLKAFLGNKTLTAAGGEALPITIAPVVPDPTETKVLITGLKSGAGVDLALGAINMVFDLENSTVTIPAGQIIKEPKYGDYQYVGFDGVNVYLEDDIVGTIENGVIHFDGFAALILAGGNAGVGHLVLTGITIR